ncbi:MBL fold metallo-hydrolase [Caenimonas terrae]|uniref:MBL fold metallo-hydrolase n=1 Tax=Caenimonas terrae TaxID=696074 RepID=A0ABW0NFI0_9BURK
MKLNDTRRALMLGAAAATLLAACATTERDARAVLEQSDRAMGAGKLQTLRYAGRGAGGIFGQAFIPEQAWPRVAYMAFSRDIDYANAAMREEFVRTRTQSTGGGALPPLGMGDQRAVGLVRGTSAWNLAGTAASAAPVALDGRIHDLWTTPHGVIKAALKNGGTVRTEEGKSLVTFTEPGRFRATVWIGADGMVERVDSVQPNPVIGDTRVVTRYSNYRDHGGIKFPARIVQDQGGFNVLELDVTEVVPNAPVAIETPASVAAFTETVTVEKAADGVWFLAGGSHNSVAIEMKDHILLVESPLYDGRAQAVLAQANRLVPGKQVRSVINSHHHFDHAGGLRAAAAQGVALVVSEPSAGWFRRVLANPNTISPDALAASGRQAVLVPAAAPLHRIGDETRQVEIHLIGDSFHAQGYAMVWLPKERLLILADEYTPGPPNAPRPAQVNPNNLNLVRNIERLKLDVDRILPLHGRMVPVSELMAAVGR